MYARTFDETITRNESHFYAKLKTRIMENQTTATQQQLLVFGWVSQQVNGNFAAWSSWKEYGNEQDASEFYARTCEQAQSEGLAWFCIDAE